MKTIRNLFLAAALVLTAVSCSDDQNAEVIPESAIRATAQGYGDGWATKVSFQNNLSSFLWSNGDCIGICRSGATANGTAAFTLLKGGASAGNFVNDAFSLNPGTAYHAFYPFAAGTTSTAYAIHLDGQVQDGNGSVAHIGAYNYMSADFNTNEQNGANFTFSNLCAVLQLHFKADGADVYSKLNIASDGTPFALRTNYNLASRTASVTDSRGYVSLSFGDGMTVKNGEDVTATIVVYPVDQSAAKLTFTVTGQNGKAKEMTFSGYAMTAGKLYHFYQDDSRGDPPYGGCPDGDHHHAVDLGLPSGNLWSCCDLGAEYPWEFGPSLAWGEIDLVTKNTSNWLNYKFMKEDNEENNEKNISKYQIPDKRYNMPWYNSADSTFVGDNKKELDPQDDAARVNWGGGWRMPTQADAEELINYTNQVWTDNYNGTGQSGFILYKKRDNGTYSLWDAHIFIPNNIWYGNNASYSSSTGLYMWTSTLRTTTSVQVLSMGWFYIGWNDVRTCLYRIRPVRSKATSGE